MTSWVASSNIDVSRADICDYSGYTRTYASIHTTARRSLVRHPKDVNRVHGLIFFSLRRFIENEHGIAKWSRAVENAGLKERSYSVTGDYPDWELTAILESFRLESSWDDTLDQFGLFLARDLIELTTVRIDPAWTARDLILNVEASMHGVVRVKNPGAAPPVLRVQQLNDSELELIYSSQRRMCRLARGLIRGVARFYREEVVITENCCMLNDSPFCSFTVQFTSAPAANKSACATYPQAANSGIDSAEMDRTQSIIFTPEQASATSGIERVSPGNRPPIAVPAQPVAVAGSPRESQFSFLPAPQSGEHISQLGDYSLTRMIGKGAMGYVFEAFDVQLHRSVAIKVLSPHLLGEQMARDRFLNEARILASISHPNVVQVFRVEEVDGIPFIVMPLLEGQPLNAVLEKRRSVSVEDWIPMATHIVEGLKAAHDAEIIHRDLKPENIWLQSNGQHTQLMDFGLSLRLTDDRRLTRSGVLIGTPNYMSPEQTDGTLISTATDIYSLGAVMYHALTGNPPFNEPTISTTLLAIVSKTPTAPRDFAPDIPDSLNRLILHMLAKATAARPSIDEVRITLSELAS